MAKIQFSQISKTFMSGTDAVKNFNLEVEDGEFVVLVGSSGCGKSTILRMVAGLEEITTGELRFDEKVVNELAPKKRNVAMVFQNYALFPNLTVEENMGFALKMQRVPKKERQEKVLAMAKILGVEDILKRKAKKLSGGQCQRIAIGRALVCNPSVFLMDEPLSNLDAKMRTELRSEIAELQKKLKVTTLYVTHDQTEAMTLGDRVVVMNQGEIQQVDTPQNLYSKPQNMFVARFIGSSSMNFLRAECVEYQGGVALKLPDTMILLPEWKAKALEEKGYVGKHVILALRSEDVYPECEGTAIPDVALQVLEGTVSSIDVMGAEKRLHFDLNGTDFVAMARTYAPVEVGDTVRMHWAVNQLHIFDETTELAIVH